jgi:hypothetical protein
MTVTSDYTDLAAHYDKRADYSPTAIDRRTTNRGPATITPPFCDSHVCERYNASGGDLPLQGPPTYRLSWKSYSRNSNSVLSGR